MFRSFAVSALAAVAMSKGDNSGYKNENCIDVVLADDAKLGKLNLCYYYSNSDFKGADGKDVPTDEFHGDLTFTSGTDKFNTDIQWGFCMIGGKMEKQASKDGVDWEDCYVVNKNIEDTTNMTAADVKRKQGFNVEDSACSPFPKTGDKDGKKFTQASDIKGHIEGVLTKNGNRKRNFNIDELPKATDTGPDYEFQNTESKNMMDCKVDAGGASCTKLNSHFYRHWQSKNLKFDYAWATDLKTDTSVNIVGFVQGRDNKDFNQGSVKQGLYSQKVHTFTPLIGKKAYEDSKTNTYECPDGTEKAKDYAGCEKVVKCSKGEDSKWIKKGGECPEGYTKAADVTCSKEGETDTKFSGSCPSGWTKKSGETKDSAAAVATTVATVAAVAALAF